MKTLIWPEIFLRLKFYSNGLIVERVLYRKFDAKNKPIWEAFGTHKITYPVLRKLLRGETTVTFGAYTSEWKDSDLCFGCKHITPTRRRQILARIPKR